MQNKNFKTLLGITILFISANYSFAQTFERNNIELQNWFGQPEKVFCKWDGVCENWTGINYDIRLQDDLYIHYVDYTGKKLSAKIVATKDGYAFEIYALNSTTVISTSSGINYIGPDGITKYLATVIRGANHYYSFLRSAE